MKDRNVAFHTKEFAFPNAIVRVYIPVLTEEKAKQRKKKVHKSAQRVLQAYCG